MFYAKHLFLALTVLCPSPFSSHPPHAEPRLQGTVRKPIVFIMRQMFLENMRTPHGRTAWGSEGTMTLLIVYHRPKRLFGTVRHSLQGHGMAVLQWGGGRTVSRPTPSRYFWGHL